MTQPTLGVLTLYLNDNGLLEERGIYRMMTIEGKKLGLDVVVFTPQDVNYNQNRIHAHVYQPGRGSWHRRWMAMPDVIFDRCRIQRSHRYDELLKFRSRFAKLNFLNRPLRNKWTIHNVLAKDDRFRPYLPHTRFFNGVQDVHEMLRRHALLYLKPVNGTGGRGILRIQKLHGRAVHIQGRDASRRIIQPCKVSQTGLGSYLSRWNMKSAKYIVQQGIQLKLMNGRVHDYRLLVQKGADGRWEMTGCAGRIGAPGSITANLHGGGRATKMEQLLRQWIDDDQHIARLKQEVSSLGTAIAAYLEQCYDALCELAIDLAIDRSGHIWLIEVNPKPAREVFRQAGEEEAYRNAIKRPLQYALWKIRHVGHHRSGLAQSVEGVAHELAPSDSSSSM
ncbi:YheC/YheD family endospore coat-associated protein [Paenibacillus chungangensis]|uniref:YheC/YheD family protein n=1 Tax=Paenibacillus chungangensis TaxID=696535 RepID=A0ABW3HXH2_9BACL